jgi:hypothetical protein
MGEPGVSRIVSVKVNENAVARSEVLSTGVGSGAPQVREAKVSGDPAERVEVA